MNRKQMQDGFAAAATTPRTAEQERGRRVLLLDNGRTVRVSGFLEINRCVILIVDDTSGSHDAHDTHASRGILAPGAPELGAPRGVINVEPGGTLHLHDVLVLGTSPRPLITVERNGTLACRNSVVGPNACDGYEQHQPSWCCRVGGALTAHDCSFAGGSAGCLSLSDGASAHLTQCRVAGSVRGKGAELHGPGTSLVAERSTFQGNHLAGCVVLGGAHASFHGCTFERAAESGGLGVLGGGSSVVAQGCVFSGNSRSGVFVSAGGHVDLEECEVSRNGRYAGMEVKGRGSSGRCRGCSLYDNARAELYVLEGAAVELQGGSVARGAAAVYSVWARDAGTEVQMRGVSIEDPPSVFDGAVVRTS